MTFLSALYDLDSNKVAVWERHSLDKPRVLKHYKPVHYFYVPTEGTPDAIALDGQPVRKLHFDSKKKMEAAKESHRHRYESDFSAIERTLMDNYYGKALPALNVGLTDIEVDYNPDLGFAGPKNPYAPISMFTLWTTKTNKMVTVAIPPPEWKEEPLPDDLPDLYLVETEAELLEAFLILIEDVDVISGWNSEYFDLPYIALRIERVLGKHATKRLCFLDSPRGIEWTEVERFGVKEKVVNLSGRIHLDYLRLFRKFTYEGRQSFSLNAIGSETVGMEKLEFNGSLYELYHFNFLKCVRYNRHDNNILLAIDKKFKFIDLANAMVHEATVNFQACFGSVQLIDTAIINFAHNNMQRVVFDKASIPGETVEGALVLTPHVGLHRWVFSCDINSLYPSVYRALNLSPEKLLGQFTRYEQDWRSIYDNDGAECTLRDEAGNLTTKTTDEWRSIFKKMQWAVSAYGTVLDQSNGEGLVPAVLTHWFKGRKELQAKKKEWASTAEKLLKEGHTKESPEYVEAKRQEDYYDLAQLNRKILLNSTYGATLNEFCRFHDPRLGASTTGTGRQITTFMIETIGGLIDGAKKIKKTIITDDKTGEQQALYDYPGWEVIYSDTDSVYASLERVVKTKDDAVKMADAIVDSCNGCFPDFMREAFFCTSGFDGLIKANREVVAESAIFQAKKKYMLYVVNLEGKDIDKDSPKALKTQGSAIKLSTTPEPVRNFLKDVTMKILWGHPKDEIENYVITFREKIQQTAAGSEVNPLEYAASSSCKVLEDYYQQYCRLEKTGVGKVNLPGNVRAAINYNELLLKFKDQSSTSIKSGDKIKLLYVKPNDFKVKSIAFPAETEHLPDWFYQHFQADLELCEEKMVDDKLEKIFHPIGWVVPTKQTMLINKLFDFE